jgi:hypothetical protein
LLRTCAAVLGPDAKDLGTLADAQKILSCAFDVYKVWEVETRPPDAQFTPRPIIIYLLTNSGEVRKQARAAYPGRVVTSDWPISHFDSMETKYSFSFSRIRRTVASGFFFRWDSAWPSVAENWIFAETRFKLIRENSRGAWSRVSDVIFRKPTRLSRTVGFSRLAATRAWWKYHNNIPWVANDTDCLARDLFTKDAYWLVEW